MPNVDGVEFPYTKAGIQKAKAWAEMTGKPMKMKKKYQEGGNILDIVKGLENVKQQRGEMAAMTAAPTQEERYGKQKTKQELFDELRSPENKEMIANLVMGTVGGGGPKLPKNLGSLVTKELKHLYGKLRGLIDRGGGRKAMKDLNKIEREIHKREMQAGEGAYKRRELSQKERAAERYEGAHDISEYDDLVKQRKELGEHTGGKIMSVDESEEFFRNRAEGLKSWVRGQKSRAGTRTPEYAQGGQVSNSNQTAWDAMMGKKYKEGGKTPESNEELKDIAKWRSLMSSKSPIDAEMMQMYLNRWLKSTGQDTLVVDKMLGPKTVRAMDRATEAYKGQKFQYGGQIPQTRRRPVMQTSQQGMPMRGSEGLQLGSPLMYKKGGKVKYHV